MTNITLPSAAIVAASLVAEYRTREWSSVKIGSVSVSISARTGAATGLEEVTVNWPGIGDKSAEDALAFAAALAFAGNVALHAERLLAEVSQ